MNNSNFEENFDKVIAKAVYLFQENVEERYSEDCSCFEGETIEWTYETSITCKYEAIMNDDYWIRHWSIFLTYCLMDTV